MKATIILLTLALAGCDVYAREQEFVCYSDGVLTERHVGVHRAVPHDAVVWDIRYFDGQAVRYVQKPGESCGTEEYNDANSDT